MSTEITTTDVGTPLVERASTVAQRILTDPKVSSALMAAESTKGLVIHDAAEASAVVDSAKVISDGMAAATEWERKCEIIPNAMIAAIRGVTRDRIGNPLKIARKALSDAHTAWVVAEQRRVAEEERKAREAAAAKVEAARVEKAIDPDTPMPASAPVVATTTTRGGAASGHLRHNIEVEVADVTAAAKAYPECFEMKLAPAKEAFHAYCKANRVDEAPLKKSGTWFSFNGLRARFVAGSIMKG